MLQPKGITLSWGTIFLLLAIIFVIIGIGTGIYYEFTDDNSENQDNKINWKRGFFRLTVIISILVGLWMGVKYTIRAKAGVLDIDDNELASKVKTSPGPIFIGVFIFYLGFVWLLYLIFQWPIFYSIYFVTKGFQ